MYAKKEQNGNVAMISDIVRNFTTIFFKIYPELARDGSIVFFAKWQNIYNTNKLLVVY